MGVSPSVPSLGAPSSATTTCGTYSIPYPVAMPKGWLSLANTSYVYTTNTDDVTSEPPIEPTPTPAGGVVPFALNPARRLTGAPTGTMNINYVFLFPSQESANAAAASVSQSALQDATQTTVRTSACADGVGRGGRFVVVAFLTLLHSHTSSAHH